MKQSPGDQKIIERMAPGILCREGFLGRDSRSLAEILDTDRSTLEGLGLTHAQVAARLREALGRAMASLGAPVSVDVQWTAIFRESMGRIPCPWGTCGVFPKGEVELVNKESGEVVRFTPLSTHLIAEHGFYQGRGARYRLDPKNVSRIFSLT